MKFWLIGSSIGVLAGLANAQFGGIFDQLLKNHQQQRQAQQAIPEDSNWVEQKYHTVECDRYLCEDTLACVNSYIECPCQFPPSQVKCILPDKKSYVCVSKSTEGDDNSLCQYVEKAWKGEI